MMDATAVVVIFFFFRVFGLSHPKFSLPVSFLTYFIEGDTLGHFPAREIFNYLRKFAARR